MSCNSRQFIRWNLLSITCFVSVVHRTILIFDYIDKVSTSYSVVFLTMTEVKTNIYWVIIINSDLRTRLCTFCWFLLCIINVSINNGHIKYGTSFISRGSLIVSMYLVSLGYRCPVALETRLFGLNSVHNMGQSVFGVRSDVWWITNEFFYDQ